MKQCVPIAFAAALAAAPVSAETPEDRGVNLMEEGAKLFFQGIMKEMEPALEELEDLTRNLKPALRSFAQEIGPALQDLMEQVEDWSLYHPPEMQPNGDIILRRRAAPGSPDPKIETPDEIDI